MKKRIMKFISLMIAIVSILVCCMGCTNSKSESPKTDEEKTIMFTDSCGREVKIPANVKRIAVTGSTSQYVILTIAPEKLVGLSTKMSDSLAEFVGEKYNKLPIFGQFYGTADINMEAVSAADPQLIIDIGEAKKSEVDDMNSIQDKLGIPTIFIESTFKTTGEAYRTLGKVLGVEERANKIGDYCDKVYSDITAKMANIKDEDKINFLYAQGEGGMYVIGKGSFHAEIMDMLGSNVAALPNTTSQGTGDKISAEQLISWKPDIVMFGPNSIYGSAKNDPVWKSVDAVANGNYFEVPNDPYNWIGMPPSINRFLGIQWMANLFYPDVFKYNMYDVSKEYYSLFYNYDLTQEKFNEITFNSLRK